MIAPLSCATNPPRECRRNHYIQMRAEEIRIGIDVDEIDECS
jgi:hypothetical protein